MKKLIILEKEFFWFDDSTLFSHIARASEQIRIFGPSRDQRDVVKFIWVLKQKSTKGKNRLQIENLTLYITY